MYSITKDNKAEESGWNLFRHFNKNNEAELILSQLNQNCDKEIKRRLYRINNISQNLAVTEAVHNAIENLTDVKSATEKKLRIRHLLNEYDALCLLDELINQTKGILNLENVSNSNLATEIGLFTLNLLFCAKQKIKQKFSIITPRDLPNTGNDKKFENKTNAELLPSVGSKEVPQMVIGSTLLYQLHHSLFPAERMIVAAGKKNGATIEIDGIFDVTGKASISYVKADPHLLARALIVMSETEKYFALWIHSHPGRGVVATHPSQTDFNQETAWLKDYSPNLVNAILVEDRYIRFWGKALKEKRVNVEITGAGVRRVSETEVIYRLEF